jgi:5'-methylthioadenosine phosphorylase
MAQASVSLLSRRARVRTPHGDPSGALAFGTLAGRPVVFLARHGDDNTIPPHEVNYRANVWALHAAGVADVVAVAAVGGIRRDLLPGALAVPDQIIDYTHGRPSTFITRASHAVTHFDFTHPCETVRRRLLDAVRRRARTRWTAHLRRDARSAPRNGGRDRPPERDGAHMVGMTGMPEAALRARSG